MKDHNYVDDDGALIPVAQLPTEKIKALIAEGVEISNADGEIAKPENVIERLRIELLIRELKL